MAQASLPRNKGRSAVQATPSRKGVKWLWSPTTASPNAIVLDVPSVTLAMRTNARVEGVGVRVGGRWVEDGCARVEDSGAVWPFGNVVVPMLP